MSLIRPAAALAVVAALLGAGCAQLRAGPYQPNYDAVDQLRRNQPAKVSVADVQPRDPKAAVNQITLRGSGMKATQGSYAAYLQDALIADLSDLSIYDPRAGSRIDVTLLKNELDISGINTGVGTIEIELSVTRGQAQRLNKRYGATTQFESSFAGAVAIPKALGEYPVLVRSVLAKVYADPEFAKALQP